MRILQDTSAAPLPSSPPPDAASPPPPGSASPPPPDPRKISPPSKPGAPPPPQAQAEAISFPWKPPPSDNGVVQKAVGGAVAGVVFFLIMLILCCVCFRRKKKKSKRDDDRKNYYPEKSGYINTGGGGSYYVNNTNPHRNWQGNPPYNSMDGGGRLKYPHPPNSGMSTEQWMAAPPPPPPAMSFSTGFFGPPLPPPHPVTAWSGYNQSTFSFNDLAAATGRFSQANLLGQGGFGYVHKGVLPNGKEIAVKSLKLNSGQGEREFQAEVDIISRVHHRHLVSLLGYCISGSQRMLVYEYVPNSTLEYHLHDAEPDRPTMEWPIRQKIALGAAKGFAYLHEDCHPRIIHRDIKATNILLDNNFEAKVADFGLAKLSSDTNTHVSTRIMGTFGYLAPEYASSGKLTEKSDVYSFGIVLLELITGRRPVDSTRDDDDDTLVDWARPILAMVTEGGSYEELVDPRLEGRYDHGQMLRMATAAAACIRQSSRKRPKMSQVVRALEGDFSLDDLHEVMKPPAGSLSASSSDYDLQRHNRKQPSLDFNSSELGVGSDQSSGASTNEHRRPSPVSRFQGS